MFINTKTETQNIVVNWHLLEPCQFKCKYCFANWDKPKMPVVYKRPRDSERLIFEIAKLHKRFDQVRISFAGGEPLLDPKLSEKIDIAYCNSLAVSIITNGDLLDEKFITDNSSKIEMLGITIDSINAETNLKIGRATVGGRLADYEKIYNLLLLAKKINPRIRIKINTVVNRFNFDEDLSPLINAVKPDKWKVLRVLPATPKSAEQSITDEQYATFKNRHRHIPCAIFEDNDCMVNSYLMIDPRGRFFCNDKFGEYSYSQPILDVGIKRALKQIKFDEEKFNARYPGGAE